MKTDIVFGQLRHVMTAVGPLLVALGWVTEEEWGRWIDALTIALGAGLTIAGFLWSAFDKKKEN